MKIRILIFVIFINSLSIAQSRSKYIWETPVTYNINAPNEMINELRKNIDTLLKYNNLAPFRVYFGDLIWETYFSYLEPARVITTLARAYKHLTPLQRQIVRNYIRQELSNPISSPWNRSENLLSRTEGKRREYHFLDQIWGHDNMSLLDHRPVLHILYGLWLYSFNSKDFDLIHENWNNIKQYYNQHSFRELNLLSGISAAIAVARMAKIVNDEQMLNTVVNQINSYLTFTGFIDSTTNFAYNGFNGWDAPYPYDTDRARDLIYMGWIYLNISPEICRFLDDYYYQQVINHHQNELNKFPFWWVKSASYWSRWTGDESVGLPSEVCGMVSPIERWIVKRQPNFFANYTRSVPSCIGDSHWIEMLIDAIELYGVTQWVDVRTFNDSIPPSTITDLRVEYADSIAYLIWTTPSDNGLLGRPFNYHIKFSNSPINNNNWNQCAEIPFNKSIKPAGELDSLRIPNLGIDSIYYIAVKSSDDFGNISEISNLVQFNPMLLDVNEVLQVKEFNLFPNYPNPFNPSTKIKFNLTHFTKVSIYVYSVIGDLVDTIIEDKYLPSGEHIFLWQPNNISSGVYLIAIKFYENDSKSYFQKILKSVYLK